MCWRCVSDSAPYVMGSAVAVRVYGARLGRAVRRDRDGDEPDREAEATPHDPERPDRLTP